MHGQATASSSSSSSFTHGTSNWADAGSQGADHSSSSSSSFLEPLHVLCERVVAQQMVEPRTAPAILEYADVAGVTSLGSVCAACRAAVHIRQCCIET
jgi:hypothetical protein